MWQSGWKNNLVFFTKKLDEYSRKFQNIFITHGPKLQAIMKAQYDICDYVFDDNYKSTNN